MELITLMRFDSIDAVREFAEEDYEAAVVPPAARKVLARFRAQIRSGCLRWNRDTG